MRDDDNGVALRRAVRHVMPRTPNQLHGFVRFALGYTIPRRPIVEGHDAPFDYLAHAFFEPPPASGTGSGDAPADSGAAIALPRDCVVWSNRGGGKTLLGAIATLLDMLFKPGVQVRILAGSFDQAARMYRYLAEMLTSDVFADLIDGKLTGRNVQLTNGSRVEVLAQSQTAVRGQHVHKLRCDEVELFDDDVWQAAQLVTRSGWCGDVFVHGAVEAFSTMHQPFGLMHSLVQDTAQSGRRVFRWGAIDVLARCEPERACESCPLLSDCGGRAKHARGFLAIDDALRQRARVSDNTWQAEMLCKRPSRSNLVYPEFDLATHVAAWQHAVDVLNDSGANGPGVNASRGYVAGRSAVASAPATLVAGLDLGFRAPTVLLWAVANGDVLHVVDELVVNDTIAEQIIEQAAARPWPRPRWIGADPAGHARNDQTARSTLSLWRQAGWPVRTTRSTIAEGIEAVRRRLRAADGHARLRIDPRCTHLIESLCTYHYPTDRPHDTTPVKDGPDHACDALRYLIINLDRPKWKLETRWY